jgi:predicted nucleic acid-binding protein
MSEISAADAVSVFAAFDAWTTKAAQRESLSAGDLHAALALVRRLDLGLRAPDAVNIAIAQRCSATLLTFDDKMAVAAQALGLSVMS